MHRIADADTADQQRGQSDDGEKLGEALDVAFERRRGVVARADFPAGLREALARFIGDALVGIAAGAVGGELQSIMPTHETAGLKQIGGA